MARVDELVQQLCPAGVEYKPLGEVGVFLRGSSFQKKHFTDEGTPCIHYGQLYTHYGLSARSTLSFLDPEFAMGKKGAKSGDLVIATTSENVEDVAKACAWLGENDIVVSNDAFVFRHNMDPMFTSHLFASALFQEQKMRFITGAKVHRISGDCMAKIVVPVPPLEVQQEIVRILDAFTELEANLQRELDARKRQYEHYRDVLLSQGTQSTAVAFEFACKSMNTGPFGSSVHKEDYVDTGIPIINPKDIVDGAIAVGAMVSADTAERLSAYRLNEGDIIIGRRGEMGRAAVVDEATAGSLCGTGCFFVRPDNKRALPDYWNHYFRSPLVRSYLEQNAVGGTMKNLNLSILGKMPVYLPPLEVQREIVDKLDAMVALQDNLQRQIDLTHKQYEHYRDALLDLPRKVA
ncbi:MAG: restriction endonuclease subunit S [Coriobacteriales bacterium]